jgi:hypothetical protein
MKGGEVKAHVRNYLKAHNLTTADWIPCEYPGCRKTAVDVHHIVVRGIGGSKSKDFPSNLVAYCREHHSLSHGIRIR